MEFHLGSFINALIYALLGIVLFIVSFMVLDKLTPYALWQEIVEHKNLALAVLVGCMSIGMCIIIASAIH